MPTLTAKLVGTLVGHGARFVAPVILLLGVAAACSDSPTATVVPTPTRIPTATASATAIATPVATSTPLPPSPTPVPSPTPSPTPAPVPDDFRREGILKTAIRREPSSLDVNLQKDPTAWPVMLPQANWLVAFEQGRRGLIPDLAERWDVADGGRRYTFHLVNGVTWHDGVPFTARDVVFTLERVLGSVSAPYRAPLASIQRAQAKDDQTVEVTLTRQDALFLPGLGALGNVVLPAHLPIDRLEAFETVGTGPFRLTRHVKDAKFELRRNDAYFRVGIDGDPLPYLDGIDVLTVPDAPTAMALMRVGRLDVGPPAAPSQWGSDRAEVDRRLATFHVKAYASAQLTLLMPNRGYWQDARLRGAVADVLDRRSFDEAATFGFGDPLTSLMPSRQGEGRWALPRGELTRYGYGLPKDPAEVARSLAAAGVALPPSALMRASEDLGPEARQAFSQVRGLLGQSPALVLDPQEALLAARVGQEFDLLLEPVPLWLDDPTALLDRRFRTNGGDNFGRWSDLQVDGLLDRVASSLDPARRLADARALQRRILDLGWVAVLGTAPVLQVQRRPVRDVWLPLHPEDGPVYRLEDAWVDPNAE